MSRLAVRLPLGVSPERSAEADRTQASFLGRAARATRLGRVFEEASILKPDCRAFEEAPLGEPKSRPARAATPLAGYEGLIRQNR
jgi:hypothetical protein